MEPQAVTARMNRGSCLGHWGSFWCRSRRAQVKLASYKNPGVELIPVQGFNLVLRPGPIAKLCCHHVVLSVGWICLGKQEARPTAAAHHRKSHKGHFWQKRALACLQLREPRPALETEVPQGGEGEC